MCNLLRKELRLAAHPSLYMFMAMGALVLILAYPYGVVFFFGGLGVFQTEPAVRRLLRRGCTSGVPGIDGLIPLPVLQLCFDIRRQRHLSQTF